MRVAVLAGFDLVERVWEIIATGAVINIMRQILEDLAWLIFTALHTNENEINRYNANVK